MPKTLLFGPSGFFGPIILKNYPEIISVGRTQPPQEVKNRHIHIDSVEDLTAIDNLDFDKVIFLIGNSNHHQINKSATMGLEYNVLPIKKVLHYLKNRNLQKFIAFTGALLYDENKIQLPVDEGQPLNPYKNSYIFSKWVAEQVTRCYPNIPTINVRLSNIYGPTRLVRPDVVPTIMYQALSPTSDIQIWNTAPQRDFIYAKDAADAVVALLNTDYTGPVNLGSGEMHSVGEVVNIISRLANKNVKDLEKKVSGPMRFQYDISLVKRLTSWQPQYSLEKGLRETYNIMKEYADECKWWEKQA